MKEDSSAKDYPFRAGSISLTRAKIPGGIRAAQRAMEEVNALLARSEVLERANFKWVGLIMREVNDTTANEQPLVRRITRDGELPVLVDVPVIELKTLPEEELLRAYKRIMLRSLGCALDEVGISRDFVDDALQDLE